MSTWNNSISITNWPNRTYQQNLNSNQVSTIAGQSISSTQLYISTASDNSPYIGLSNVNIVQLPTYYPNFSISSLNFYDTGEPDNISQLVAYEGELFLNGIPVISTLSTSVLNWSQYPAISDVFMDHYNIRDVEAIAGNTAILSTAFISSLYVSDEVILDTLVTFSTIYTQQILANSTYTYNATILNDLSGNNASFVNVYSISSIYSSNINFSTFGGDGGNYISTALANLSNASTFNESASNWWMYQAKGNVDINNNDVNNAGNIFTNAIVVGGGGQTWNGNAQFNGTGNTFQPYWYNFTQDVNTYTANSGTIYCPSNLQYWSDWSVNINCFDAESLGAFTNTKLHAFTSGLIVPTGYIDLRAHNYRSIPILPPYTLKDYRGQLYMGTDPDGYGAQSYIGINYDSYETLYNQGGSIILNADSVLTNPLGGASRITTQSARNQLFGTATTEIYAGYVGLDPVTSYFAGILQYYINADGVPAQYIRTRGGDLLPPAGARTDVTAETPSNTSVQAKMNIYCSGTANLYTDGSLYIGYGGSTPDYGWNNSNQQVHILNANDIQGRVSTGVTITNLNSIQGINTSSFIQNIHYLIGFQNNNLFNNVYETINHAPILHSSFGISTIPIFLDSNFSTVTSNSSDRKFSTLSNINISTTYYVSSFVRNNYDVSTFKTNLSQFNVNSYNEILGISTILSSFIINVDKALIKNISCINLSSYSISAQLGNISSLSGGYANSVSTNLGILNKLSTNQNSSITSSITNWSLYKAVSSVNLNNIYSLCNVNYLNLVNHADNSYLNTGNDGYLHLSNNNGGIVFDSHPYTGTLNVDYISPYNNSIISFTSNIDMGSNNISNINQIYLSNPNYNDFTGFFIGAGIGGGNCLSYYDSNSLIYQAVAGDWYYFSAQGNVDINFNRIINIGTANFYDQLSETNGNISEQADGYLHLSNDGNGIIVDSYLYNQYLNVDSINSYLNTTINFNNSVNLGQYDLSGVNNFWTNQSFYSIPDSSNFVNFRYYNGYFSYYLDSISTFVPIASDWSAFGASNTVEMNYNSITDITSLNIYNPYFDSIFDFSYTGAKTITASGYTFPQLSYYQNPVGILRYVAQDWSFYDAETDLSMNYFNINNISTVQTFNLKVDTISSNTGSVISFNNSINMCNNNISNVAEIDVTNDIHIGGSVVNTSGTGELDNFPTLVFSGYLTANPNYLTYDGGDRIEYEVGSSGLQQIANLGDIPATIIYENSSNFTTNKTVANATSNVIQFSNTLVSGVYNVQYAYNAINHNNNNFNVVGVLSNGSGTQYWYDSNAGANIASVYTNKSGIVVLPASNTYYFKMIVTSQTGNSVTFSNGVAVLSKLPV